MQLAVHLAKRVVFVDGFHELTGVIEGLQILENSFGDLINQFFVDVFMRSRLLDYQFGYAND